MEDDQLPRFRYLDTERIWRETRWANIWRTHHKEMGYAIFAKVFKPSILSVNAYHKS